jgi:hypothetical protein
VVYSTNNAVSTEELAEHQTGYSKTNTNDARKGTRGGSSNGYFRGFLIFSWRNRDGKRNHKALGHYKSWAEFRLAIS